MNKKLTKIEIFCGTGGVGKTTLATSRAMFLSSKEQQVLLITIDPSKRLKQILHLDEYEAGTKNHVAITRHAEDMNSSLELDAILMSPRHTFEEMNLVNENRNKILEILMRPNGGMNEIMAIIEVQKHIDSGEYDTIVLDTPPGKHFLDFLKATQKIDRFFDKSFIEIFKYFGKKFTNRASSFTPKKVFGMVVSTGLKKLLKYLEVVTGKEFVDEFVDAIFTLYNNKDKFLAALSFQKYLDNDSNYQLYLVASTEQQKLDEILEIQQKSKNFSSEKTSVLINKSNKRRLDLVDLNSLNEDELNIHNYFLELETKVSEFSGQYFGNFKVFEESMSSSPKQQVLDLLNEWEQNDHI